MWSQRLEAALASGEQEAAASQRAWEAALTDREAAAAQQLAETRQAGQAALVELQAGWAAKLAAEEKRWLEVRLGQCCPGIQEKLQPCRGPALFFHACTPPLRAERCGLRSTCPWSCALPQEKHTLELQWAEKLHGAERAASEGQAALRTQVEGRLAAVAQRVAEMAQREARREAKRSECFSSGSVR